ncbi:serine/threonine-protein kinase MARK2-like isoform X1 [Zalophus californianus]|uniref:Serine/threonine-protein kinase MARK2-like isoform X1 n=1 Tax=Zalophus californianus TaxID=9704 RepID=A0A6J2BGB9_ZALCA|nr:serine/threonine-protein kinase MARK2-like isoform X1 [Zalophus californianus]
MSMEYENLKKFFVLNPIKGGTLEEIMKVLWTDMDHGKELMPYVEPLPNHKEPGQTVLMVSMGYTRETIQDSETGQKNDEVIVIYVLLPYKRSELVGYAITLKAQALADPTNSCPLYSSCKGSDERMPGTSIAFKSSL